MYSSIPFLVLVLLSSLIAQEEKGDFVQPKVSSGYIYYHDVFIGENDGSKIYMEICAPSQDPGKKLPVLARIHGGGWNKGSKNKFASTLATDASKMGYVGVAMMYRLTPSGTQFPELFYDLKLGIRYLRAHASNYFIDPDKIGVWGSSSGGHLASLLGTTGDVKELEGPGEWKGFSSRVQAVVDASGPADFTTSTADAWSSVTALLGGKAFSVPELALKAMPGTYATKDDPPFLILHGDEDTTVPPSDSLFFNEQLRSAKVDVTFSLVKGAGHSLTGTEWVGKLQYAFMDYVLKGIGKKPTPPPYEGSYIWQKGQATTKSVLPSQDTSLPIALWSFEEDNTSQVLTDTSTSDPNVLLKRNGKTSQESVTGKIGKALHFKDGYSYLTSQAPPNDLSIRAFNFYQKPAFTIELWLKLDQEPSTYAKGSPFIKLISKLNSATKSGYELSLETTTKKLSFRMLENGQELASLKSTASLEVGQWIHLLTSVSQSEIKFFMNGNESGYGKGPNAWGDFGESDLRVGGSTSSKSNPCSGLIGSVDELRLYDRLLTTQEIKERVLAH